MPASSSIFLQTLPQKCLGRPPSLAKFGRLLMVSTYLGDHYEVVPPPPPPNGNNFHQWNHHQTKRPLLRHNWHRPSMRVLAVLAALMRSTSQQSFQGDSTSHIRHLRWNTTCEDQESFKNMNSILQNIGFRMFQAFICIYRLLINKCVKQLN